MEREIYYANPNDGLIIRYKKKYNDQCIGDAGGDRVNDVVTDII